MTAIVKRLRKPLPTFPIRRRDPSYRLCVRAAWNIGTLQEFVSFALALNEVIPARIKDSDTFLWTPGQILLQKGILPDICFTSLLKRAVRTLNYVLEETDLEWLPVVKTVMLNERHYGILQGLNKAETAIKYGEEQVRIWRRSYDVRPPALNEDDPRNPRLQKNTQTQKYVRFAKVLRM